MNPPEPDRTNQAIGHHAIHNPLQTMQPGESVVCEIKRHPVGILGIYAGAGFLLVVLAVLTLIVGPNLITSGSHGQAMAIGTVIFTFFAALALVFVFISNKVYWGNGWVVTSDSVTQMTQSSLFDKRSSQLSLGNLEDVTAEQKGIIAHVLNYGVIRAETAGERSKFMLAYCPNPNYYAQQVINAREKFEQGRQPSDSQPSYRQDETNQANLPTTDTPPAAYPSFSPPIPPTPQEPGYNPYTPADPENSNDNNGDARQY